MLKITNSAALTGGYADHDVQPPVINVVLGHGGLIAADKEGLFRHGALELAGMPFGREEVYDGVVDARPEPRHWARRLPIEWDEKVSAPLCRGRTDCGF